MNPWREALHQESRWGGGLPSPTVWIILVCGLVLVLGFLLKPAVNILQTHPAVTVYTSQDKVYAEVLFKEFTRETGIEVRAVFDSEAVKTVGIANRLLAEQNHPQCDVFWNNEELRTRHLAREGLFAGTPGWSAFGYRSRRLVINTNLVSFDELPRRFSDLTNTVWKQRVTLAYPLFGTTATHFMAWRSAWGEPNWTAWCLALQANQPMVLDGNSVVVRQVGRGEAAIGMTDFDDIQAGLREGFPIAAGPLLPDAILIPNTVALIDGAPNPAGGRAFIQWLQRPETLALLKSMNAIEGTDLNDVSVETLTPNWRLMLDEMNPAMDDLKQVFLR